MIITCDVIEPIKRDVGKTNPAEVSSTREEIEMQKFTVHTVESAPEQSRATLRGMQQKFGFLPNIMGTMAENPVLLNGFAASFGSFHGGSFDECEKQVLLLTNAVTLKCPWTVAAHSTFAIEDGVSESDVKAIRAGKLPQHPKYAALSQISRVLLENRGNATDADIDAFTSAGYCKAHILEVVLGIGISMTTATTTNVAGTPLEGHFQAQTWAAA